MVADEEECEGDGAMVERASEKDSAETATPTAESVVRTGSHVEAVTKGETRGVALVHHRRPRLFYLDLIRAFATVLIVVTHFNNPYLTAPGRQAIFINRPFNTYIGDWGVSLFLIISGAALMYTHGDQPHTDWKHFYYRRFITIFPMYWIAFIIANAFLFVQRGGSLPSDAPKWRILLSVFAMDGLAATGGIRTFYTLGEWFLGFILLFYLIYPLLQKGVREHPWVTAVIIMVLYAVTVVVTRFVDPSHVGVTVDGRVFPSAILLTMRLPELAFGMYFTHYFLKVRWWGLTIGLAVLVMQCVYPVLNLVSTDVAVTCVGISSFVVLVWLAKWIEIPFVTVPVGSIAKYSYPIFLVHHVLITFMYGLVRPQVLHLGGAYLLLVVDGLLIMLLAWLLARFEKVTVAYVKSMLGRPANA